MLYMYMRCSLILLGQVSIADVCPSNSIVYIIPYSKVHNLVDSRAYVCTYMCSREWVSRWLGSRRVPDSMLACIT
jgi:hypothetical protein